MPATEEQPTALAVAPDAETPDSSGAPEPTEAIGLPEAADVPETGGFAAWYRARPLIGGIITVLAGAAMFLSSQLDLGNLTIHVGVEGMQATILPIVVALAGVLAVAMPAHRIFYGVIALAASVYSLVAVNLGGFFVGFLLGCVGGIMVVSWAPRRERRDDGAGVAAGAAEVEPEPDADAAIEVNPGAREAAA
ncbi:DUF6114 domain-containing protein [Agromyces endophyticus]|uniref:DUF6114 domain-containing protein n=1 Tax=Agromyces sp. H17E-10 TaxID=2932244 RepID=UPI001FD56F0A|nr:DUF6114 domain-containing protein [Agromyces sp. H17E-10]UOQ88523.1 DUF6114 domain-containing protein [Agromyces sp. H17E-10]